MLKLIEEPSSKKFFILINNQRKKIIDTLRSRSIEFKIFLNQKQKESITNELLNFYDLPSDKINNLYNKQTVTWCTYSNFMLSH